VFNWDVFSRAAGRLEVTKELIFGTPNRVSRGGANNPKISDNRIPNLPPAPAPSVRSHSILHPWREQNLSLTPQKTPDFFEGVTKMQREVTTYGNRPESISHHPWRQNG